MTQALYAHMNNKTTTTKRTPTTMNVGEDAVKK
jgi:hypothetical protein